MAQSRLLEQWLPLALSILRVVIGLLFQRVGNRAQITFLNISERFFQNHRFGGSAQELVLG